MAQILSTLFLAGVTIVLVAFIVTAIRDDRRAHSSLRQ